MVGIDWLDKFVFWSIAVPTFVLALLLTHRFKFVRTDLEVKMFRVPKEYRAAVAPRLGLIFLIVSFLSGCISLGLHYIR